MPSPLAPLLSAWRRAPLPEFGTRWAVAPAGRAFSIAGLFSSLEQNLLVVVPGEADAEELVDDLGLFVEDAYLAPAWETLPFEHVSPNLTTMGRRAEALHRLSTPTPALVVASVRSAVQRLSPSPVDPLELEVGAEVDLVDLASDLASLGYLRTDRVEARGEFAVRGGIVDVFAAQASEPIRLDFWGDELTEARVFSVSSQRSLDQIHTVVIFPAREVRPGPGVIERARELIVAEPWAASTWDRFAERQMFPGMESWLPWLADEMALAGSTDANVVVVDPSRALDRSRDLVKEESELAAALAPTWGESAPAAGNHPSLYLDLEGVLWRFGVPGHAPHSNRTGRRPVSRSAVSTPSLVSR